MGESCQQGLLTSPGMMDSLHGKQFPLDGIMRLLQECAGYRHLGGGEARIPAGFFVLKPAPPPLALRPPSRGGHVVGKVPSPLAQCTHAPALALARSVEQRVALGA